MIRRKMAGHLVFLLLIVLAAAYLPPPEDTEAWGRLGDFLGGCLPRTLHVTYVRALLFRLGCILLVLLLCGHVLKSGTLLRLNWGEMILLGLCGLHILSVLWAHWARGWWFAVVPLVFACAWAISLERLIVREGCERLVMKGIWLAGLVTAGLGLVGFLLMWLYSPRSILDPTFRLAVPHRSNSNFTAAILITPALMSWYAGVRSKGRRVWWLAGALMLAVALLLTRSASGFVGLVVSLIVLASLAAPGRWRWRILGICAVIGISVGVWILALPGGIERCVEFALQGTRAVRYFFWQDSLEMILRRPLLGWGTGGFFYAYPVFRQPAEFLYPQLRMVVGDHAHSEMLNIGVELGLVGMAAACAFVAIVLTRAAARCDEGEGSAWRRALIAGTTGMLVQSCFSPCLRSWDVAPFFWTQIGVLLALARHGKAEGGASGDYRPCRLPHRMGCWALMLLALGSWLLWCRPEWRAEQLLAEGFGFDPEDARGAQMAAPYLREGSRLTKNAAYWFNAGRRYAICLRTQGRWDEAVEALESIDREVPNLGTTRLYLGELYGARFVRDGERADCDRAVQYLRSYVSANHDARGYLKIAKILRRSGVKPESVFPYVKMCLELDPGNRDAGQLMAEVEGEIRAKQQSE